ncbi:MAG: DUF364 domain-containing protein [Spirochaetia bacterium]|jgi:hypothetical protein|nr:DUF364 domain-containing protein [Spirochaetia bacterium]
MNDLKIKQFYDELSRRFASVVYEHGLSAEHIEIHARALTPEEAIGHPGRTDYPILTGKEQMIEATCNGARGQAFTDAPSKFTGTVADILTLDLVGNEHDRGLFIASMNAVLRSLHLIEGTVHCKDSEPEECARQMEDQIMETFGHPRILQVGFQPALVQRLGARFSLRVLDLNPDTIGSRRSGILIEDGGKAMKDAICWADLILCTGSTLANGTIVDYIDLGKKVIFFGTTLSGAAYLMGLERWCFCSC